MTVQATTGQPKTDTVSVTIDGYEISRAQGHPGDPGGRDDRRRDPEVLRPPAARPDRRLPAVPGGHRGPAQAARLLHHRVHRGHGGQDPAHLGRGREGAARRDGAAAGQPPARLPDVRQGRRVPAAEPGARQRAGRVPLPRGQARVRQAGADLDRGAARPRAVHLLHPLRADLGGDRGRRLHRVPRARPGPVHRHRDGQAVQLLLLRQHGAGLPGRRAHRRGLPVQGPPVRPGVHAERVRALRVRLPPAHRPPAGPGAAPPGRRRAAGQRGVELRQGPLGVRLRQPVRPAHHPAGPRRGRRAPPGLLGGRLRGGRARAGRGPGRRRGTVRRGRADRRAADARGRLRVRQVRPGGAEHQRHRHAGQAALGRGGAVPRRPGGRPRHRGQLRRPRGGARGAAGRVRAGRRIPDRVPAAAQGGPQDRAAGVLRRRARHARPDQGQRHPAADRARGRARHADRARRGRRQRRRHRRRPPACWPSRAR